MEKIWSPDVQIINRGHDFPHNEEYKYKAKIYSDGWVYAIRNYRFKADINVNIELGSSKSFIFVFFLCFWLSKMTAKFPRKLLSNTIEPKKQIDPNKELSVRYSELHFYYGFTRK